MKKMILTVALLAISNIALADKTLTVDAGASKLNWLGKKVTGQHEGTINLKNGSLIVDDKGALKSAEFVTDMNSIVTTDLSGEWKDKLEGHLKHEDFFGVDKHKEAKLVTTKVTAKKGSEYEVEANLTIKGITKPVKFNVSLNGSNAKGSLKFDRTKYDIKYGSGSFFEGLGDKMIYDDVELNFSVVAK